MIVNNEFLSTTTAIVLFVVLAAAVVTDLRNRQIPNLLLLPALYLALMLHSMSGGISGLITAASGLTLGLAMLLPLYLIGGMAAGDVKLLGVVGSFVGPWAAVVAGLATMMVGAVFGITFIVWRRLHPALESQTTQILSPHTIGMRRTSVPHSSKRPNDVTYIPYAPAVFVGTAAALWYLDYFPDQLW